MTTGPGGTSTESHRAAHVWSPHPTLVGLSWVLAAGTLAWVLLGTVPTGRVLAGVATIGLLLFALFGTLARPRLAAGADGVTVRRLGGRQHWAWGRVRIRVMVNRRFGRRVATLELEGDEEDGTETLVVLGWLDLGTEPESVAEVLRSYRT